MTVINSNISAQRAQASLAGNARKLDTAMERLSTGLRINSAKDDAAGLAITNRMTAQINGLNQAVRNANDGLSMIATIDGSLKQSTAVLQRMRELAVQSANGTNSTEDRVFLQAEMVQLNSELDRISSQARFNGMTVLDGTFTNKQFQIGANGSETIGLSVGSAASSAIGDFEYSTGNVSSMQGAMAATAAVPDNPSSGKGFNVSGYLGNADIAFDAKADARTVALKINEQSALTGVKATAETKVRLSDLSAAGNVYFKLTGKNMAADGTAEPVAISANLASTSDLANLADQINTFSARTGVTAELSSDRKSVTLVNTDGYDIQIADFAAGGSTMNVQGLKSSATADSSITANDDFKVGGSVTLPDPASSAKVSTRIVGELQFSSPDAFTLAGEVGADNTAGDYVNEAATAATLSSVSEQDIKTPDNAANTIRVLDGAIAHLSSMASNLGALASRLEKTVDALTSSSTNTSAARSRILDTDYASETSQLAKAQIIAQASQAMLAQANQQPQQVLQLLKQ